MPRWSIGRQSGRVPADTRAVSTCKEACPSHTSASRGTVIVIQGPVLAAIDLADASDDVLRQANLIAAGIGGRLVVCYVLHEGLRVRMTFPHSGEVDARAQAEFEGRARVGVEARVSAITQRPAGDVEILVDSGSAHARILNFAEHTNAGLVVVGPGTVAERVARYAPCPLLVVRPSRRGSVLGATDLSDPSFPAIEAATAEATRRERPLRLIHCVEAAEPILLGSPTFAVGVLPALPLNIIEELENDARNRLRASLAESGVSGEVIIARGRAEREIVEAARQVPTELVVIGIRGRTNVSRLLLDSVAEAILKTAPCSVLVVHLAR
jgi:universal stress protein A